MRVRSRRMLAGLAGAVAMAAGSVAVGQVTYMSPYTPGSPGSPEIPGQVMFFQYGQLTLDSPLFQRPGQSSSEMSPTPPTTLATGQFRYHVMTFSVPADGVYEIYSAQAFDGYLHLYGEGFDPTNPLFDVLAGDDDMTTLNGGVVPNRGGIPGTFDSGFRLPLLSGPSYRLVTSTFSANSVPTNGNFYNEVRTPVTPAVPPGPGEPSYPIPDAAGGQPGAPVVIELTLDAPGTISQFVSVGILSIAHTWIGDLTITLEHVPSGTKVDILDRPGRVGTSFGNSINFLGDYTFVDGGPALPTTGTTVPPGTYGIVPNPAGGVSDGLETLSAFNGLSIAGTWRLTVRDWAQADTGYLSAFSMTMFVNQAPSYVLGDFNFDGGLDGSDVDPFVLALSDLDAYLADFADAFADAYPGMTLDASVVDIIGDFNGDSGFDGSDVDGFIEALSTGRPGTAAIPEPAALGLLAPAVLLVSRRRR